MGGDTLTKKALSSMTSGVVKILLNQCQIAGLNLLTQAAGGRKRNNTPRSKGLEPLDIGAIINLMGQQLMCAAMACEKRYWLAVVFAAADR